eukprot:SAG31_NODE_1031_length_10234_cov_6.100049_4_plen_184_part_00
MCAFSLAAALQNQGATSLGAITSEINGMSAALDVMLKAQTSGAKEGEVMSSSLDAFENDVDDEMLLSTDESILHAEARAVYDHLDRTYNKDGIAVHNASAGVPADALRERLLEHDITGVSHIESQSIWRMRRPPRTFVDIGEQVETLMSKAQADGTTVITRHAFEEVITHLASNTGMRIGRHT